MSEPCATHPEALAGWRCDDCKLHLCGECTARTANLYYCCLCGATATQLTHARTDRAFSSWLLRAFAYPLTRGLPLVAIFAVLIGGAAFTLREMGGEFAGWSIAIRAILLGLFVLLVVDATARGGVAERGLGLRLLRGLLGTAIVWAPAAAYAYFLGAPAKHDWTIYLFGGLATVYLPIALAVAVTDVSIGTAMNPFSVFELAWALGRRYLATLATALALGALLLAVMTATVDKLGRTVSAPVAGDVAAILPSMAVFAIVLHAIGLLVYVHGHAMGFGAASHYLDPVLPDEIARGRRKDAQVLTTEALTKASEAFAAGASPEERADHRKVIEFLKSENLPRALKVYEGRASWSPTAFDDRQLLALGKAALRAKSNTLAQRLFEEGIAKEGRATSQLLIALAQLLGDVLGRGEEARTIYEKVIKQYKGSDAAKIAQQRLGG